MARFNKVKGPPSKTLNRTEKRKAERKLKKARKVAFSQRKFDMVQTLKNIDSAYHFDREQKNEQKKIRKIVKKEKKKKKDPSAARIEAEKSRVQGLRLANNKEDKELRQLEKGLKFRKKKGKTNLPGSFAADGLDYLLDATDSEKIKDFDDIGPNAALLEDSSSDSDNEDSFEDDMLSDDTKTVWNPKTKAKKSIVKTTPKEDKIEGKKVKFAIQDDQDSDKSENEKYNDSGDSDMEQDVEQSDDNEDEVEDDDDSEMGSFGNEEEESEGDYEDDDSEIDSTKEAEAQAQSSVQQLKEDIYGRLRDKDGNVVTPASTGSYIPPARRAVMQGSHGNEGLRKKLKGFVNRISEGTIQALSSQVESLYLDNSRADVNETLSSLVMEAVVTPIQSPERLVLELSMLIAILHHNVGSEVGAFFLQKLSVHFDDNLAKSDYGPGKLMENTIAMLSGLYNFKIVHSNLVIDIIKKLLHNFKERDIELLLHILKLVGFTLRKDNPVMLKQVIMDIQLKARENEGKGVDSMDSRIRFIIDVLSALKNNNMNKIPGYDPTHLEHLRKLIKTMIRGQTLGDGQLNIKLDDLLKADKKGRWWIVGSAWEGRSMTDSDIKEAKNKTESYATLSGISKQMLKLAKQQGMNTDIRRHIFCILGTSEDYEDAFTRLLRLGLNKTQEREIVHVLFHCCLNEKDFNPFYGYLSNKLCSFDRRFAITVQFTMWDKFKEIDNLEKIARSNLGHLLAHLLLSKALSMSVFKVISFGMESKKMIRFLVLVLTEVLMSPNIKTVMEIFERIAPLPKLKPLRQGLQVFMHINLKGDSKAGTSISVLRERIEKAEYIMFSQHNAK